METAKETSQVTPETVVPETIQATSPRSDTSGPVWVEPDLDFIRALSERSVDAFRDCLQCGNCSATCDISPDHEPYPRKEMAWANWGMKDRLLADPDVWLCHQCNDCSTRCPAGARPGDVLAAIRHEIVLHHAIPRFLSTWVNTPKYVPLLFGLPALLLGLALLLRDPIDKSLGLSERIGERIIFSYSYLFPHWLLNGVFFILSIFVVFGVIAGIVRFWRTMRASREREGEFRPVKGLFSSIVKVLASVIAHKKFSGCVTARSRYRYHIFSFYGYIALSVVTFWVITAPYNPLIQGDFIYPFDFWSPWKLLANLGGLALLFGTFSIIRDRLIDRPYTNPSTYFEWAFLLTLFLVVLSGFATEALHYFRLEPHRHVVYFVHLMLVFALLMTLPFSKFAHVIYRATAMVFAEYTGRYEAPKHAGGGKR